MAKIEGLAEAAAKVLVQRAMCELAKREVQAQLINGKLGQNGTFWREVQASIETKSRTLDADLAKMTPSGTFTWKDLFRFIEL